MITKSRWVWCFAWCLKHKTLRVKIILLAQSVADKDDDGDEYVESDMPRSTLTISKSKLRFFRITRRQVS